MSYVDDADTKHLVAQILPEAKKVFPPATHEALAKLMMAACAYGAGDAFGGMLLDKIDNAISDGFARGVNVLAKKEVIPVGSLRGCTSWMLAMDKAAPLLFTPEYAYRLLYGARAGTGYDAGMTLHDDWVDLLKSWLGEK